MLKVLSDGLEGQSIEFLNVAPKGIIEAKQTGYKAAFCKVLRFAGRFKEDNSNYSKHNLNDGKSQCSGTEIYRNENAGDTQ